MKPCVKHFYHRLLTPIRRFSHNQLLNLLPLCLVLYSLGQGVAHACMGGGVDSYIPLSNLIAGGKIRTIKDVLGNKRANNYELSFQPSAQKNQPSKDTKADIFKLKIIDDSIPSLVTFQFSVSDKDMDKLFWIIVRSYIWTEDDNDRSIKLKSIFQSIRVRFERLKNGYISMKLLALRPLVHNIYTQFLPDKNSASVKIRLLSPGSKYAVTLLRYRTPKKGENPTLPTNKKELIIQTLQGKNPGRCGGNRNIYVTSLTRAIALDWKNEYGVFYNGYQYQVNQDRAQREKSGTKKHPSK